MPFAAIASIVIVIVVVCVAGIENKRTNTSTTSMSVEYCAGSLMEGVGRRLSLCGLSDIQLSKLCKFLRPEMPTWQFTFEAPPVECRRETNQKSDAVKDSAKATKRRGSRRQRG